LQLIADHHLNVIQKEIGGGVGVGASVELELHGLTAILGKGKRTL
jgi:hypothetical protein